jgi:hypothetical protein
MGQTKRSNLSLSRWLRIWFNYTRFAGSGFQSITNILQISIWGDEYMSFTIAYTSVSELLNITLQYHDGYNMNNTQDPRLAAWHRIVFERDLEALSDILAEDIVFRSPFLWKPYQGRMAAFVILSTVIDVFQDFAYHRELTVGDSWALEFSANLDALSLKGIDLIQFNDQDQIQEFEVFIRPANALNALGAEMGRRLSSR